MLSVIIATRNDERALVHTLAILVSAAVSGLVRDVVVADQDSQDETAEVADMAGCTVLVSSAPLAQRLGQAVAAARAPWLLFLRPGAAPDSAWATEVERFIENAERRPGHGQAAVFRREALAAGGDGSLASQAVALVKEALRRVPSPEQGLLISRSHYEQVGGHRGDAADPETDLLRRIGSRRLVRLRSGVILLGDDAN
jgi:glycosyltransferase involved in cell wall biosynthesis